MFHHKPTAAQEVPIQTAIVHVADVLVKAMGCGDPGDQLVPPLSREAWNFLALDDEALQACIAKAGEDFQTINDYL